ncbi:MAG: hypothetical protein PQJ59_08815 [Spirochaetales bacterium]|nr:hypothetical protein [Spirochaetales bacterium]
MKKESLLLSLVILFLTTGFSPLWSQTASGEEEVVNLDELEEEEVSLDDLEEDEFSLDDLEEESEEEGTSRADRVGHGSSGHGGAEVTDSLKFTLLGDIILDYENADGSKSLTFDQEHTELFLNMENSRGLSIMTDVVRMDEYLEFHFPITQEGSAQIYMGNLLVPFGEYKYHHFYGGSVDMSQYMVDTLWTELGAGIQFNILPTVKTDIYITNGMSASSTDVSLSGDDTDSNLYKAVGTRWKWSIPGGAYLSLSTLVDIFGDETDGEGWAIATGLDGAFKIRTYSFTGGGLFMTLRRDSVAPIEKEKWAWYGQATKSFTPVTKLRVSLGQVDTNTRTESSSDLSTAMFSLIQRTHMFQVQLDYEINQCTHSLFTDDDITHSFTTTFYFRL